MTGYTIFGQGIAQVTENKYHSHYPSGVVFSGFPLHGEDYADDVQAIMEEAIEKYGEEEWRLAVLTSELHGHLGVYAIIGAKMGLYAREILSAGHDELNIKSYAGSRPPVSCMNDGLQVSTGATLGHGLISIADIIPASPAAEFTHEGKTIKVVLKDEINKELEKSIKEAVEVSGGLTAGYWLIVREIALECWLGYDRQEIFEVRQ